MARENGTMSARGVGGASSPARKQESRMLSSFGDLFQSRTQCPEIGAFCAAPVFVSHILAGVPRAAWNMGETRDNASVEGRPDGTLPSVPALPLPPPLHPPPPPLPSPGWYPLHPRLIPAGRTQMSGVRLVTFLAAWMSTCAPDHASSTDRFDVLVVFVDCLGPATPQPRYLGAVLVGVMLVVFLMFGSLVLPFRLALAIVFTLAATFGFMVLVYQTPLLHGILPWLSNYDGLCYEVCAG